MKKILIVSAVVSAILLAAGTASAHWQTYLNFGFYLPPPPVWVPPPPPVAVYPGYPSYGYYGYRVWVPGYWESRWSPYGWTRVWIPGILEACALMEKAQ